MFGISPAFVVYSYTVWDILVLVPDPTPTAAWIVFSIIFPFIILEVIYVPDEVWG